MVWKKNSLCREFNNFKRHHKTSVIKTSKQLQLCVGRLKKSQQTKLMTAKEQESVTNPFQER